MKFDVDIVSAHWQGDSRSWLLTDAKGRTYSSRYIITAMGILSKPTLPTTIEGVHDFQGECFHTTRWPQDWSPNGKRIGIIGTGVIDPSSETLFLAAKTYLNQDGGEDPQGRPAGRYYLHALDVNDLSERDNYPINLEGTVSRNSPHRPRASLRARCSRRIRRTSQAASRSCPRSRSKMRVRARHRPLPGLPSPYHTHTFILTRNHRRSPSTFCGGQTRAAHILRHPRPRARAGARRASMRAPPHTPLTRSCGVYPTRSHHHRTLRARSGSSGTTPRSCSTRSLARTLPRVTGTCSRRRSLSTNGSMRGGYW